MTNDDVVDRHRNNARSLRWAVNLFGGIAIASLILWTSLPVPKFEGLPLAIAVVFFLSLLAVAISSFGWILLFGKTGTAGRAFMVIVLVVSILSLVISALFVMLALLANGLFRMI
jgi:hypothetical protein